ncbi:OmpH family outer membrane protein [Ichthyenterobacterium magnum]|uniref:Periplasmic chaperone for outer membrane proteins Skp n=1 Tax=Ichthyenterobacterium magnum TaxID=1230530 RepID=A0A420DF85_9FLAO|nr:OmpH family outer membrane protein [Ichthyenterobacterium magnum]RKE91880.1 periplasmic chaperone for outer membrane proteins Skp [Ichthyenterobacterium magnum]
MKQFKTLLFAAVLFIGATSFSVAQSKIAHINTTQLVEAMPEMKAAKAEIEKLTKTYEADIKTMATELQNKVKQYQAEVDTKTEEENAARGQEVQTMEQSIRQYQGQAQQDLQKKEADLLKPIFEKAKAAIDKVSKAQGFQYVLDSTQGGGVLVADGKDLLADVKKELGF